MNTIENISGLKLDLACGDNKKQGFIGVDISNIPGVDVVADLEQYPWPFEDNSVEAINVSHYIEHTNDLIKFIDECYRIMKVGAKMEIVAPYYSSIRAWADPTHKRAISELTPFYYNKAWRTENRLEHYGIKADFDFESVWGIDETWKDKWLKISQEEQLLAVRCYINVISDITIYMTKRAQDNVEKTEESVI